MLKMRTKREEGRKRANKDAESGAALTKRHDNCQALSKIKSKGICIKCHQQNSTRKHKNTPEDTRLLLLDRRVHGI